MRNVVLASLIAVSTYAQPSPMREVKTDFGDATLHLNASNWIEDKHEPGAIRFHHVNKHVVAWMMSNQTGGLKLSDLKHIALEMARKNYPGAQITRSEPRTVSGHSVLYVEFSVVEKSTAIRFAGYYHGGVKTNLQVVAFSTADDFDKYRQQINEFINGIEIKEASTPEE